jgi:hypothetical protein
VHPTRLAERVEDVTAEQLGGASRHESTAFTYAVVRHAVRQSPPLHSAARAAADGSDWRTAVAWATAPEWEVAQRLTAEEAAAGTLAPPPEAGAERRGPAPAGPRARASPGSGASVPAASWEAGGGPTVILQQLCAARGVTLEQLAERAGVALTTVVHLDAGTARAQPATLRRLAPVLGLAPDALRDALSAARRTRRPAPPGGSLKVWR